ncbi:MAG: hypothetical protein ACT6RE_00505 [Flavobacteriales bacterium]
MSAPQTLRTALNLGFMSILSLLSVYTYGQKCIDDIGEAARRLHASTEAYSPADVSWDYVDDEYRPVGGNYDSLISAGMSLIDRISSCTDNGGSGMAAFGIYKKVYVLLDLYSVAQKTGDDDMQGRLLDKMEYFYRNRTDIPENIPHSSGGSNYTVKFSSGDQAELWYGIKERRGKWLYSARRYKEAANTLKSCYENRNSYKMGSDGALMYAHALIRNDESRSTYFPPLAYSITRLGDDYMNWNGKDSTVYNNRKFVLNNILNYEYATTAARKYDNNAIDPDGKYRAEIARGLYYLDDAVLSGRFAREAADSSRDVEFAYFILEKIAIKDAYNSSADEKAALQILNNALPRMQNIPEVQKARAFFVTAGNSMYTANADRRIAEIEEAQRLAAKRERMLNYRRSISITPTIELIGLPLGHALMGVRIRKGKVLNELNFDYVYNGKTRYRFGGYRNKPAKVSSPFRYTGFSAGYGFIYLIPNNTRYRKGRSILNGPTVGFDLRYSQWNLEARSVNRYSDAEMTQYLGNTAVNPVTRRFELAVRTGYLFQSRWVSFDYYLGIGIGYRTLSDKGTDYQNEYWTDDHYHSGRFNKLYAPFRFGIRLGFNIL